MKHLQTFVCFIFAASRFSQNGDVSFLQVNRGCFRAITNFIAGLSGSQILRHFSHVINTFYLKFALFYSLLDRTFETKFISAVIDKQKSFSEFNL